jgi:hypothetical protein
MRTLAKRSWREAENTAQIHLANVSTPALVQAGWRKQKLIDNRWILPDL